MYRWIIGVVFFSPLLAFAYTSVIANPEHVSTLIPLEQPTQPQVFFGKLKGYPHTFEFFVSKPTAVTAALSVIAVHAQKSNASLIMIKQNRRGVSEIGRTLIDTQTWKETYDPLLALKFKNSGEIASELSPGTYRLEVSSPDNDAYYKLVIGNEASIDRSYFENLSVLFAVHQMTGTSRFMMLRSPLLYWPVLVGTLLIGGACLYLYMYKRKQSYAATQE